ncbi:hypothetical protein BDB01DRAFT_542981 [Pilobolus umbonatus]|nr:hypothetical protein BDB01DRAFT_542981 [Pilobolus umbonatus]
MLEEKKLKRMEQMKQKQEEKQKRLLEKEKTAHFEKENRLKNNRKETLKEMIVDIHPDFLSTPTGESVQKLLTEREVTIQPLAASSKYSLSWKRKCTAEWNADSQTFIPISDTKIEEEACLLVYLNTDQFVQAIQSNTLDTRIDSIQQAYPNHQIMLVIEGLEAYYKKQSLIQKRQFQSQVLESLGPMLDGSSSSSRKRKKTADIELGLSQKSIEEYLVHLQLIKKVMHVCTKDGEDSASWIENFTADLAVGRYNKKNLNQAIKVMKSGTDPNDTYFKMLQEVQLCTPAIANSIISEYPTLNSLHQAYENEPPHNRGLMLAHLEVQRSVVRARDRTINRVMSNKIYKLFNSEDPNEEIS